MITQHGSHFLRRERRRGRREEEREEGETNILREAGGGGKKEREYWIAMLTEQISLLKYVHACALYLRVVT